MALPENIRLGRKCLPRADTRFLDRISIYGEKMFITLPPESVGAERQLLLCGDKDEFS
jgi:hypothetical protein